MPDEVHVIPESFELFNGDFISKKLVLDHVRKLVRFHIRVNVFEHVEIERILHADDVGQESSNRSRTPGFLRERMRVKILHRFACR